MTGERRGCAFKVNIARNIKNRFNKLNYSRYGKLETNME